MGLELQTLDSGCCGMAGPFGFEKENSPCHKMWEKEFCCRGGSAAAETLIVRRIQLPRQIEQATGRKQCTLRTVAACSPAEDNNGNERPSGTAERR